jgi:hypothetical protein
MDTVNGLQNKISLNLLAGYAKCEVTGRYPTLLRDTAGLARGINTVMRLTQANVFHMIEKNLQTHQMHMRT